MKTRFGFVSNSSTTSFCIYGVRVNTIDAIKAFAKRFDITDISNLIHKEWDYDNDTYDEDSEDIYDDNGDVETWMSHILEAAGQPVPSTIFCWYEDTETLYVGNDLDSMGMDETKRQFRARTENQIRDLFPGLDLKFDTIEESIGG